MLVQLCDQLVGVNMSGSRQADAFGMPVPLVGERVLNKSTD